MQNWDKRGHVVVTQFGFLGPSNISGMNEARNFKFGTEMMVVSTNEKMKNWVKRVNVGVT